MKSSATINVSDSTFSSAEDMCEKAAKEMATKDIRGKSFMVSPVFFNIPTD